MKRFFSYIFLALVLNALVKPASVLVENAVQNKIGHYEWGKYAAWLSLCFLLGPLCDLGINTFATAKLAQSSENIKADFSAFLGIKGFLVLCYPVLLFVFGWAMGYQGQELGYLVLIAVITALGQLSDLFRSAIKALQAFALESIFSVLEKVILLIGTCVLLYFGIDLQDFILLRLLVVGITLGIIAGIVFRKIGLPHLQIPQNTEAILKGSFVFTLTILLTSANEKIDQVLLKNLIGNTETGLYSGAYRWLDAINMYLWTILPFFFARFAYLAKDISAQQKLLNIGQVLSATPLIFMGAWGYFFADKLLFLFPDSSCEELSRMTHFIQILFLGAALNATFAVFGTLLTASGYSKYVNVGFAITMIINILLNFFFIPKYGGVAAAWTTVFCYAIIGISYTYILKQYTKLQIPYFQTFQLVILFLVLFLNFFLLQKTNISWFLQSLIGGIFTLLFLFILTWKEIKTLKNLLKKGE